METIQCKFNEIKKMLITIIVMVFVTVLVLYYTNMLKNRTNYSVVKNGSLSYEEQTEGILIRDEIVLQGEKYKNGMVQILADGERAAKGEAFFRYYSNSEENILNEIAKLDEEINNLISDKEVSLLTSDITSLEAQIETVIDDMHNANSLQIINENKNKIDAYISKKTQITGEASPEDSYLKQLVKQRNDLEKKLEDGSEIVAAPKPGLASYRIDGLEEILKVDESGNNNFDYLSKELIDGLDLKVAATIPLNNEKGKIVNNFKCYIAAPINTEKAMAANVGDIVKIRLSTSDVIEAEIVYIKDEEKDRIIVFEINSKVSKLLEYRKISFDIIWWNYTGLKVSNSALIEEDDKTYIERSKAGYTEKVLVKVLRQNDTYSIVENYDEEELKKLGYSDEEIEKIDKINLYDEIVLH